ncbi:hypothetical protein KSB_61750 [Ktedonobacter robiniae]|uniref:Uncharacterized protein n=1 Tax=Ktedonobacter robiniae TaxID=2778365 RepID=A0ABQ3UZI9_9CHLR|nr:hypothetical protein KSB_61750 [Ktedonobacter robiniae]
MVWLIESESLINAVIDNKLKVLASLTKRYVVGSGVRSSPDADTTITGGEAGPNPCMVPMRNVVNRSCPWIPGKPFARKTDGMVGRG